MFFTVTPLNTSPPIPFCSAFAVPRHLLLRLRLHLSHVGSSLSTTTISDRFPTPLFSPPSVFSTEGV